MACFIEFGTGIEWVSPRVTGLLRSIRQPQSAASMIIFRGLSVGSNQPHPLIYSFHMAPGQYLKGYPGLLRDGVKDPPMLSSKLKGPHTVSALYL